jgi:hypothetical protein
VGFCGWVCARFQILTFRGYCNPSGFLTDLCISRIYFVVLVVACVVCVHPQEEARRKNRSLQSALEALESEMTSPTPDPDRKTKLQIQVRSNSGQQRHGKCLSLEKVKLVLQIQSVQKFELIVFFAYSRGFIFLNRVFDFRDLLFSNLAFIE